MGQLLSPYVSRLVDFLRSRLDPRLARRESAVDLVQSACREVIAQMPRFDTHGEGKAALERWLYRKVLRKLADRHRFHGRDKRDARREDGDDRAMLALYRSTVTPSKEMIAEEERDLLRRAIAALREDQRVVIELVYFHGLPHDVAALRLGRSLAATRSLLARALARLSREVGGQG